MPYKLDKYLVSSKFANNIQEAIENYLVFEGLESRLSNGFSFDKNLSVVKNIQRLLTPYECAHIRAPIYLFHRRRTNERLPNPIPIFCSTTKEARGGIGAYIKIYNSERLHLALDYLIPDEAYYNCAPDKCYDAKEMLLEVA